jgi:hypothetical protein
VEEMCLSQKLPAVGRLGRSSTRDKRRKGGVAAIGTFQICVDDVRSDMKVLRDVEDTGNNIDLESSRKRILQWRSVKANSIKEAIEIDADKRQAKRRRD